MEFINTITNKKIIFDDKSYVLNLEDLGAIKGTHFTSKSIGQAGEYVIASTLESRNTELIGFIISDNKFELEDKRKNLIAMINPLQCLVIFRGDKKIECLPTSTVKFSSDYKENNDYVCKFFLDVFCPNPYWIDITESKKQIALWKGDFHFPLVIPANKGIIMGHREPSLIVNVENKGQVKTGMIIEFYARGTLKNPSLFNVNTREVIKINKGMVAGEKIIINTNFGKKKILSINNGIETDILNYLDIIGGGDTFLQLNVGDNLFRYDADENLDNLEVSIYYNNNYLGV